MSEPSVSFDMVLLSLEAQVAVTQEAKEAYESALAERNSLIRSLIQGGMPYRRMARITGLSRNQLHKIGNHLE